MHSDEAMAFSMLGAFSKNSYIAIFPSRFS